VELGAFFAMAREQEQGGAPGTNHVAGLVLAAGAHRRGQ